MARVQLAAIAQRPDAKLKRDNTTLPTPASDPSLVPSAHTSPDAFSFRNLPLSPSPAPDSPASAVTPTFDRSTIPHHMQITPAVDCLLGAMDTPTTDIEDIAMIPNNPRFRGSACVKELMDTCGVPEKMATLLSFYGGRI